MSNLLHCKREVSNYQEVALMHLVGLALSSLLWAPASGLTPTLAQHGVAVRNAALRSPRLPAVLAQQGPLEEGFKEVCALTIPCCDAASLTSATACSLETVRS